MPVGQQLSVGRSVNSRITLSSAQIGVRVELHCGKRRSVTYLESLKQRKNFV